MSRPGWHLALLAGGRGTRFWPASRAGRPKQFLPLGGDGSLLRQTFDRFQGGPRVVPPQAILVVAPREYHPRIAADLPELPASGLIDEPSARDTAAAVGLACLEIRRRDPRGLVVVSPTDHRIARPAAFEAALDLALDRAAQGGLGTLGVRPDRAATEFGYLETGGASGESAALPVARFVEKPDPEAAARHVAGGRHLWNAGLFVFRVDVFFDEAARVAPALALGLEAFDRARASGDLGGARAAWESIPRLSLDYAVMERAGGVWTVPLDAGWDDLGGWEAAGKLLPRDPAANAVDRADAVFVDTRDCTVFRADDPGATAKNAGQMVVLVGVEGLTVVQTGDVVLVCRTDRSARVREAVERVQELGRRDLL